MSQPNNTSRHILWPSVIAVGVAIVCGVEAPPVLILDYRLDPGRRQISVTPWSVPFGTAYFTAMAEKRRREAEAADLAALEERIMTHMVGVDPAGEDATISTVIYGGTRTGRFYSEGSLTGRIQESAPEIQRLSDNRGPA